MNKINKIYIGYPPFESDRGVALLSQNRQFQWFKSPTYIYPVVPATAATMIKNAGYEVDFIDAIARNMNASEWYQYLDENTPDLLFFEVKTPVIYKAWKIANTLKEKYPKTIVVIGGDHITAMPEETMQNCKVDYLLCGGDYDFLLLNLIEYLNGKSELEKGIYYRENGIIKNTGMFELRHDLKSLPFIDRDLTDWKRYAYDNGNFKRIPGTYIMAGRDCWHHRCTFCSWTGIYTNFRARTAENVVDEIEFLYNKYNIKEIMDDTGCFPIKKWLNDFCNIMIERKLNKKVNLDCNMRFGSVNEEEYRLMKKAGFRFLLFGLESASQNTLDKLKKGNKAEEILPSCKAAADAGLSPHITVMLGYPWETEEDIEKTYELTKKLLLKGYAKTMQATIIIPYPGTELFNQCKADNLLLTENWEDYDMRQAIMKTEIGEQKIKEWIQRLYNLSFTPRFLAHKILSIRDLDDIKYYLRAFKKVSKGHLKDFA